MMCAHPFAVKSKEGSIVYAGRCRWCMPCRINLRNDWVNRWNHEQMYHPLVFVTLTYNDDEMPYVWTKKWMSIFRSTDEYMFQPTLMPEDCQLFQKRLRINLTRAHKTEPLKFVCVGEYGSDLDKAYYVAKYGRPFGRPHYHYIISGYSLLDTVFRHSLKKSWLLGNVTVLPVLRGGVNYVYKYMDKQLRGQALEDMYDYCTPPFRRQSHGIGEEYLIDHLDQIQSEGGYRHDKNIVPLSYYWRDKYRVDNYRVHDSSAFISLKNRYPNLTYDQLYELIGSQSLAVVNAGANIGEKHGI